MNVFTNAKSHARERPVQGLSPSVPCPSVLITGGSSGVGAAVAARFAAEGAWDVLLSGRDRGRLGRVADACGAVALPEDLRDRTSHQRLVSTALTHVRHLDVLVASAGVGWAGPFDHMPADKIDEILAVDLAAVVHLTRLVLPHMLRRDRGHLAFIGSIAGSVGVRDEAVYAASKAALETFATSLRYELRGTRVGISMIIPGAVDTPFFTRRGRPYHRSRPHPVSPVRVAEAVHDAVVHRRAEVYLPAWLRLPARFQGVAPGLFHRLATRLG
ncbi:SDR family NAD(P)-dependent oxidoreductase [Streptomyces apocyni]|uniref:SDR family NAD(P)-dependent oxidoreductase n=1 Tax=Streptomyces apocyni TaxID=2654677 RepID=UPI0012E9B684|nr:SDR family NAD(P)-dependent oxidoreductase [Streptomyces apocyni]